MTEKTISVNELLELAKDGAQIKTEPKSMVIAQFNELVASLKQLVENERARVEADRSRNQTNLEVIAALQAMIRRLEENRKISGSTKVDIDLTPIKTMLEGFLADREARGSHAYEFQIRRDGRGFAQSIIATPVQPTLN